eukprot:Gb_24343 [translate_table: standard]
MPKLLCEYYSCQMVLIVLNTILLHALVVHGKQFVFLKEVLYLQIIHMFLVPAGVGT